MKNYTLKHQELSGKFFHDLSRHVFELITKLSLLKNVVVFFLTSRKSEIPCVLSTRRKVIAASEM